MNRNSKLFGLGVLAAMLSPSWCAAAPVKLLCEVTFTDGDHMSLIYTFDEEHGIVNGPFPGSNKVEISDDYITITGQTGSTQINRLSGEYERFGTKADGEEVVVATGTCSERKQAF